MYTKIKLCLFSLCISFLSSTYDINSQNKPDPFDFAAFFEEDTVPSCIDNEDLKYTEDPVQDFFFEDIPYENTYSFKERMYIAYLLGTYKITEVGLWGYNKIRTILNCIINTFN